MPAVLSPLYSVVNKDFIDSIYHYALCSSAHLNMHYNQPEEDNEHAAYVQLHFMARQNIGQLIEVDMESEGKVIIQKVVEQAQLMVN